jgi:hypothetical protein
MATTTTNYGFDIPQSTDLVKDGATAIATLGQDIDTAMNTALGTKKAGMVLLNTTSFSGVASQSFNDVFSATYNNYLIRGDIDDTSGAGANFRLRVGGSDNSSSNYKYSRIYIGNTNATGLTGESNQSSTGFLLGDLSTQTGIEILIFSPFLTKLTTFRQGLNNDYSVTTSGTMTVTTSYTGFTIVFGSSATGELSVYGFNK